MMVYLGLFAPVLERLAFVAVKVAVNSMAATWPALYMLMPSDSFSNFPLQVICLLTILTSIFCYTTIGSKMLNLLLCSEARHRHTTGNPNLRIGFVLRLV
ncbi:hypothetical protein DSO57_1013758 [Entomophthora muscae]|uniref:Uncharacterized protein n=1 Tax=Entomophthora muscae TaxID=34485 RepID=A0ACC2RK97_9FUNG|nr:hypothetical protein DSO57_1013758 [Entomophthora muscae]